MGAADKLDWYRNRLRTMSFPEMTHRALRYAEAQWERTVRARFPESVPEPVMRRSDSFVRVPEPVDVATYRRQADAILDGQVELLFKTVQVGLPPDWNRNPVSGEQAPMTFGKTLDYRDTRLVGDIKYLWVLNRHHHTLRLAQAYALTAERRYLDGVGRLVDSWLQACPYPNGANWTSSLELSIRLLNWSVAWHLIGGSSSVLFDGHEGTGLRSRWMQSIYRHQQFIRSHFSRHSSANNHLLGEAAGLFVASLVWPCWDRSPVWGDCARALLEAEVVKQVSVDGVDREQSVFYQNFVLEFLLAAGICGQRNGAGLSSGYWQRVRAMLEFPAALMDVGGHLPAIGDSDDAIVLPLDPQRPDDVFSPTLDIGERLFGTPLTGKLREQTDAGRWYDLPSPPEQLAPAATSDAPRRAFAEGGYYLMGSRLDRSDEIRVVVNAGHLGYLSIAAHGHADALSFTLSVGGEPILIDPGTYAYQSDPLWRNYFRGTGAHNTVRIDGVDQAVIGGNFMWLSRFTTRCDDWSSDDSADRLSAWHDGYLRLRDPVRHRRTLHFDKTHHVLEIVDELDCREEHLVERFFHYAPDVEVDEETDGYLARRAAARVLLLASDADSAGLARGEEDPISGWISERFGAKRATTTIRFENRIRGRSVLTTRLRVLPV